MLSKKLRELRLSRKWTVQELADKVQVGKSAISKYENGDATPRKPVLEELARVFGVSIAELLDEPTPELSMSNSYDPKSFEKIMSDARSLDEDSKKLLGTLAFKLLESKRYQQMVKSAQEQLTLR